ncbi:MAG: YIP1 family protein [Chloroflexaceae bacterium]|nr:YIP1 family protein [Chloroflexaceae bacterium]
MFQQMIQGSIAVLTRPSVSTFEEHEQDNLGWALIYVAIGAALSGLLGVVQFMVQRLELERQIAELRAQMSDLPPMFSQMMEAFLTPPSLVGSILSNAIGAIIWFLLFLVFVYAIGRAFGGTGSFGELAFDIALFSAPLTVVGALLGIINIGPLGFIIAIVGLVLSIYQFYLTYLGVQSGLNLPSNKALYTMLLVIVMSILIACMLSIFIAFLIAAIVGAAGA